MPLVLVTAPQAEPITLDEVKAHLRIDGTDEDTFLTALIKATREHCESPGLNRALITQTWELWLDSWPKKDYIPIPRPPLQAINSVKYYGADDTEYTFDPVNYFVDTKSEPGRVALEYNKSWPSVTLRPTNGIVINFDAGYGTADDVPQIIKHAMLLLIGHWYENREATVVGAVLREIPFAVKSLLAPYRIDPKAVMIS